MSYWDTDVYKKRRDTPYDLSSPYEKYLQDREKVNIACFDIDAKTYQPPRVCPDCPHIPLIPAVDKKTGKDSLFCKECGMFYPLEVRPKPIDSQKIKQRATKQSKTFVKQLPHQPKKKGGSIGAEDTTSELSDSEIEWVSRMYGNVTDITDS